MEKMDNWVLVFNARNMASAQITAGMLKENGIESHILNKQDSEFFIGSVDLYVETQNEAKARQLLSEHSSGE
ncbi:MAG: DUF2007 domain-containing protein [Bacteroidales bacterium]|jgi:hypothetical protein|nr:DUF2007 domain-containing protein [Bacteroidales bacterium]NCU35606.1 hypothetical protein [Candidatus Falkowbacteria bacterium]MDD2632768.1 DUF2007 domain-containing protein [Bacteroidales bacterium]MDD3131147.1 DUF2007 domain-containing protein [Bacteroidales bacterium]MDD3525631.1 DUF2007 domain-containing protein [Bacteroidales bacterium]